MFQIKNKLSIMCIFVLVIFIASAFPSLYEVKAANFYYFNNAVNTDPEEIGNYWYDEDLTDPALELPDFSVDGIVVTLGSVFAGDITFNGDSGNFGEVTGNAVFKDFSYNSSDGVINGDSLFYGEDTGAEGIMLGSRTRYYSLGVNSFQDLTFGGAWTVIADGVEVNIHDALYDGDTVFTTLNSGYFDTTVHTIQDVFGKYSTIVGEKLYSIGYPTDNVTVIDITTDTVVSNIPVGSGPNYSVTVGDKVYVANSSSNNVSVIDTNTDTVVETIPTGNFNFAPLLVSGTKVYVVNSSDNTVSVIDSMTDTVVNTIDVGALFGYSTIVGDRLYLTGQSGFVYVIDTKTDTLVDTIATSLSVVYVAIPVGPKIYFIDGIDGGINNAAVFDTRTNTLTNDIGTLGDYCTSAYTISKKAYVVCEKSDSVWVIDSDTDTVIGSIPVGQYPRYAHVVGKNLYVNNQNHVGSHDPLYDIVSIISSVTDTVINSVRTTVTKPYYSNNIYGKLYVQGLFDDKLSVLSISDITSKFPNLLSFSTTASSGTYSSGDQILIRANFGRPLLSGSTMTVQMNSGGTAHLNSVNGNMLSGTYTIGSGDTTPDLKVDSVTSANIVGLGNTRTSYELPSSVGDFEAENSFITRNLGDSKNISIGSYRTIDVGDNPYQISGNIDGYAYVANQGSGDVSVIRISDDVVVDTIDVGTEPYGLTTATVLGIQYLYVANTGSDDVSVINTLTNSVVDTIDVGVKPYYVTTLGTNVYVTNGASNTVSVIDTNTNTITDTIAVGSYPRGIKAHGTNLYVANYGNENYPGGNYISVIDTNTNTVTETIISPAGTDGPRGVNVLGSNVYVANFRSDNVMVIDTNTNTVTDVIDVGKGPRGVLGSGIKVYVENFDDGTVSVIDTNTNTVTDVIDVGHSPAGMSVIGSHIYYTRFQDNQVSMIDTATNELVSDEETEGEEDEEDEEVGGGSSSSSIPKKSLPSPPLVTPTTFKFLNNLKYVIIHPDVMELQKYLNTHNFMLALAGPGSPGFETNMFGPLTKKAVVKFQKSNGLLPDGIVGPKTRAVLNSVK